MEFRQFRAAKTFLQSRWPWESLWYAAAHEGSVSHLKLLHKIAETPENLQLMAAVVQASCDPSIDRADLERLFSTFQWLRDNTGNPKNSRSDEVLLALQHAPLEFCSWLCNEENVPELLTESIKGNSIKAAKFLLEQQGHKLENWQIEAAIEMAISGDRVDILTLIGTYRPECLNNQEAKQLATQRRAYECFHWLDA